MAAISRRLPLILLLLMLVAMAVYLQWPESATTKNKHERVVSVKTTQVNRAEYRDTVEAIGTGRANEQVLITSQYSDLVDKIYFNDGDVVSKGDVLVTLHNQEEQAKVKEFEANLAESVAQLDRFQDLLAKKAISKSVVDQQDAKTKAVAAQLVSARTKLTDLTIKAPFSGVLGFREISLGALIDKGDVITSLDDLSKIKVDFSIPERFLTAVAVGQAIEASTSAYSHQVFHGVISSIDSRIDIKTRTLKIRAELPNPEMKLRAGMLFDLQVVRHTEQLLQLPESAIIPIEDQHFVFVVEQDKAYRKPLTIGRRFNGFVEVLDGLAVGTQVVIEGALKLRDGTKVNIIGE